MGLHKKVIVSILLFYLIINASEKKEDLSKALIPYQIREDISFGRGPKIGALHQLGKKYHYAEFEKALTDKFQKALTTKDEAQLKDLLSKGFDINLLDSKELYHFFKYTFEKNGYNPYSVIDLVQQIKNMGKRLFAVTDLIIDRSIGFHSKQDIINVFLKDIRAAKIIKPKEKEYESSLFSGLNELINSPEFKTTGIVSQTMLNNIKNKELSEFFNQKNNFELLFNKKGHKATVPKIDIKLSESGSNGSSSEDSDIYFPKNAFDTPESRILAGWKVYINNLSRRTTASISNWFTRLKAQTSSWITSIKNWWNRRP